MYGYPFNKHVNLVDEMKNYLLVQMKDIEEELVRIKGDLSDRKDNLSAIKKFNAQMTVQK